MKDTIDIAIWNKIASLKSQLERSFINLEIYWIQKALFFLEIEITNSSKG